MTVDRAAATATVGRRESADHPWWRAALPHVVGAWITARVLVGLAYLGAHWGAPRVRLPLGRLLDNQLLVWDGRWYLALLESGYAGTATEGQRFFPLFPVLARWITPITGGSGTAALILLANLGAVAAGFALHRVCELWFDRNVARRAVWVAALSPGAFSLVLGYTESLALTFAALWFIALRRRNWCALAVWGAAAALTRPVGVLLALPLLIELIADWRAGERPRGRTLLGPLAALAAPAASLIGFLVWVELRLGDWTRPIREQSRLRLGIREPIMRLAWGVANGINRRPVDLYNVGIGIALVVLLVLTWRRLPRSWWWSAAATVWIALAGGYIDSVGRYAASSVPVIAAVALLPAAQGRHRRLLLALSAIVMFWLCLNAFLGYVVP